MNRLHLIIYIGTIVATLLTAGCGNNSRRAEIEQRKAALKEKQDSTLAASQAELAWVDSALQAATTQHERLLEQLHTGSHSQEQLQRLGQELTLARLHRDSLQVRFDVLCGVIKYIHRKQGQQP
jgi:multidrug resistance efflux pump